MLVIVLNNVFTLGIQVASIVKEISTCLHRCGISASLTTYRPDPPGYDFDLLERTPAGKIMSVKLALGKSHTPMYKQKKANLGKQLNCHCGLKSWLRPLTPPPSGSDH